MTPIDPFACSLPPFPDPATLDADGTGVDGGSAFSALLADCLSDALGSPRALLRALAERDAYRGRIATLEQALRPFAEPDELPSIEDWDRAREVLYAPVPEPAS